jgi:hypothetical protein
MSYDFSLRIPAAMRKRGKKGDLHPTQVQRLARAREILQAHEPDIRFDDDAGPFTAFSDELGEVHIGPDRIALGLSMATDARVLYSAIHGLMKRFHAEGYEAVDPQLTQPVVYCESFADFMRHYREHFPCPDDEFDQWCGGVDPPIWAERQAMRECGEAAAASALPRCDWDLTWEQRKALSDDALWAHLLEVTERIDALIAAHGLTDYLSLLSAQAQSDQAARRLDGGYYPDAVTTRWFQGSLLHYESTVLAELKQRGYPAAVRAQPQQLTLIFDLASDQAVSSEHADQVRGAMQPVIARLKADGLVRSGMTVGQGNRWRYFMYGDDVDAIHQALLELYGEGGWYPPLRVAKRYGELGAREVELPFADRCR